MVVTDVDARLAHVLSEFALTLVGPYDIHDVLVELCEGTGDLVDVDGCGIMLMGRRGLEVMHAAPEPVLHLHQAEQQARAGICHAAFHGGEPVMVPDLTGDTPFPDFARAAVDCGYRSSLSLPLAARDVVIGSYTVYRNEISGYDDHHVRGVRVLAAIATSFLVSAQRVEKLEELSQQLQSALDSRVLIEQAKGRVAQALSLSMPAAFELLRAYARPRGRRLVDVARDVVDGTLSHTTIADEVERATRARG